MYTNGKVLGKWLRYTYSFSWVRGRSPAEIYFMGTTMARALLRCDPVERQHAEVRKLLCIVVDSKTQNLETATVKFMVQRE